MTQTHEELKAEMKLAALGPPKQVIVMRKDLNMRKGKMVAQGAHASMKVVLDLCNKFDDNTVVHGKTSNWWLKAAGYGALAKWLNGAFTKICVSVNSERELLDVCAAAKSVGMPYALITDNGLTEFNGVPTNTCCAIGPAYSADIDKITGHLKLL